MPLRSQNLENGPVLNLSILIGEPPNHLHGEYGAKIEKPPLRTGACLYEMVMQQQLFQSQCSEMDIAIRKNISAGPAYVRTGNNRFRLFLFFVVPGGLALRCRSEF
jgi:hypothetical protein